MNRAIISSQYMNGIGLEIGAYHHPWPRSPASKTLYADRRSRQELIALGERDPNLQNTDLTKIPETDYLTDANTLDGVPHERFDYVASSHVLEHCYNPIGAIHNWLRRCVPGGNVIMAVPEKTQTFDRDRPLTTWDDMLGSFIDAKRALDFRRRQYIEYFTLVDRDRDPTARAIRALSENADIHFCVWDTISFRTILENIQHMSGNYPSFQIELFEPSGAEIFAVLRRW